MMRVLTLGMSIPVSMMVVHTSTWVWPWVTLSMTADSSLSSIRPWATSTVTSGSRAMIREAVRSMLSMRLCR